MQTEGAPSLDLLWGVNAIAKAIDRTPRQTFHLCSLGEIPARKIGGRWVVERRKLIEFFVGDGK